MRISVRDAAGTSELKTVDTMAGVQAEVLAGTVNPGQLRMVREILTPANGTAVDTAVFSGASSEYTITGSGASVTVAHTAGTGLDGTDTVRNVELLQFTDRTVSTTPPASTAPAAPTAVTAVAGDASATVSWTAPASNGGSPITGYEVDVVVGTTVVRTVAPTGTATSTVVTGLTNGTAYTFQVRAVNSAGLGALSASSNAVTPTGTVAATRPAPPVIGTAVSGVAGGTITATANWAAPTSDGGSAITGYRVFALRMNADGTVAATTTSTVQPATARSLSMTVPVAGNYQFQVNAINAIGTSNRSAQSNTVAGR